MVKRSDSEDWAGKDQYARRSDSGSVTGQWGYRASDEFKVHKEVGV